MRNQPLRPVAIILLLYCGRTRRSRSVLMTCWHSHACLREPPRYLGSERVPCGIAPILVPVAGSGARTGTLRRVSHAENFRRRRRIGAVPARPVALPAEQLRFARVSQRCGAAFLRDDMTHPGLAHYPAWAVHRRPIRCGSDLHPECLELCGARSLRR